MREDAPNGVELLVRRDRDLRLAVTDNCRAQSTRVTPFDDRRVVEFKPGLAEPSAPGVVP